MKKKTIKSALPIYASAAVWLLLGLICPRMLLKIWFLVIAALISAGAYFAASKVFKGREVEVREKADSGNREIDEIIEDGRERLDGLKKMAPSIQNPEINRNMSRMIHAAEGIFSALEKDTSHLQNVRRFMNYYLPLADKLIRNYVLMNETGGKGENIANAMKSVESSMSMIAEAFEKQMDNLFYDRAMDVETDIEVLETMMASDGLIDGANEL